MKCTNCGGELLFEGKIGICQSCGSQHNLDVIFEKTDVCLCYTEYDDTGRRTKDSIIAQEVYNKLESKNIRVFYERISASNSLADELEMLRYTAINHASIIIVIGTTRAHFETIVEKYGEQFKGKTVVPFYADITPGDIPSSLNKLQALNYGNIGWEKDLTTGIFNILGIKENLNFDDLNAHAKKKKHIIIIAGIVFGVLLVGVALFFLTGRRNNNSATDESAVVTTEGTKPVTKQQIYENAAVLVEQGDWLGAIELYSQILDFKDSQQKLDDTYAKYYANYAGTYLSDDKKTMVTLDIKNNTSVEVTFKQNRDGDRRHYSATTVANIAVIEFDGIGKIELLEEKISFSLEYAYDPSLNVNLEFTFAQMGDPSEYDSGIREELLSFFDPNVYPVDYGVPFVSREELYTLGYNLDGAELPIDIETMNYATKNSYESTMVGELETPGGNESYYDFESLKRYHGASYYDYVYDEEKDLIFEFDATGNYSQVHNVLSVFGRASLLTPDKIGQKPVDFTENGVVYSFVNAGEVLQKDDWVNITSYNPDHLKEYNEHMDLIDAINSTDFSNKDSVLALNKKTLTLDDFMLSNYKLKFSYYTNNINGFLNHPVYEIVGTDYFVIFDFRKNGEFVEGEIFDNENRIRPDIATYG